MHENLQVGDYIEVARGFATSSEEAEARRRGESIERQVFVIGGIGVSAFLRTVAELEKQGAAMEVHYAVRSMAEAAYREVLPVAETTYYPKDEGKRLNFDDIVPGPGVDGRFHAMIYCCGPDSLMNACELR